MMRDAKITELKNDLQGTASPKPERDKHLLRPGRGFVMPQYDAERPALSGGQAHRPPLSGMCYTSSLRDRKPVSNASG